MHSFSQFCMLLTALSAALLTAGPTLGAESNGAALLLNINGSIGPASSDYVVRGLEKASRQHARVVIIRMDTPGGLDSAMRSIIKEILSSPVPVVSYVAPSGARAASAGTYIMYASHVAAMAPATTLGAATPVQIGGIPGIPETKDDSPVVGDKGEDGGESGVGSKEDELEGVTEAGAMKSKIINDAAAYIRGLANRHGRNAQWAELAVTKAATLTADEALKKNVIDIVTSDIADLLVQLDGRVVRLEIGKATISTTGMIVEVYEPDWRSRLLSVITDPNVAYILMLIGIYGLIFELSNPGSILPGVVGAICLLLALYAFQVLPINYAGLGLMILGIMFMVAEAFMPSFGVLGLGGVVAFVAGSIILMGEEQLKISLPLIGGTALVSAGFFMWVIGKLIRVRRQAVVSGAEQMIGATGYALDG
ncbi:MAG: nodulation protein NfeD, partial [Gammaproteobacteria bacterium]|nr:nodulation protein NfeD [Gammaproteobacteria bacterium]